MKKAIVRSVSFVILLFCVSQIQAQYSVFNVKGTAEKSMDGKKWDPLKKKVELKASDLIRLHENSLIEIIDSTNLIYSLEEPKTISVGEIVKKRKSIFEALNEESGKRTAIGGVERGIEEEKTGVCLFFTDTETLNLYDNQELIPEGSVFFITLFNQTKEDRIVNVYQKVENGVLIPCFPKNIKVGKNSSVDIDDLLFGKQANIEFLVVEKKDNC